MTSNECYLDGICKMRILCEIMMLLWTYEILEMDKTYLC